MDDFIKHLIRPIPQLAAHLMNIVEFELLDLFFDNIKISIEIGGLHEITHLLAEGVDIASKVSINGMLTCLEGCLLLVDECGEY